MKKVLLSVVLSTICAVCMAQSEAMSGMGVNSDASIEGILSMLGNPKDVISADSLAAKKSNEVLVDIQGPSKFLHKNYMRQSLDVSPSISIGKTTTENSLNYDTKETSSTGWGLNFGYSLLFVPGREKEGMLKINTLGFAYVVGFMGSFAQSDRYGPCCSLLAKLSIELGSCRMLGLGFDVLGGCGKSPGDVYFFSKGIVESDQPDKIVPYTSWCWQYGTQVWMKVNIIGSLIKNAETLIFARLLESVDPQVMTPVSSIHANIWKGETWFFGTTIRYSF